MSTYARSVPWQLHQRLPVTAGEAATGVFGEGPPVVLVHGTPPPRTSGGTPSTLAELVDHWDLTAPALVGHAVDGGSVPRAHLLDAAVLGPWNTPFTEHQQRYAEAYRTMPARIFGDL
ncbi:hypothetical protein, partial [Streptomyces sclerotialus]|uniref:hypothetical protein n=1 Tax=Streptomyces sclerotialus TaxID=1957 RepID=UPI0004C49756